MKKYYHFLLIISILVVAMGTWQPAQASTALWRVDTSLVKIDARVNSALQQSNQTDMLTVIVTLRQRADLSRVRGNNRFARLQGVIQSLQSTANITQGPLNAFLRTRRNQGRVQKFKSLWVINGFSITASPDVINELAQNPDVLSISADDLEIVPAYGAPEPNIALVNAPALWDQGYTGQGVIVANMDSGVDVNHPDLSTRWRGGTNSWFDPYGQHPATPTDLSGHGTWTMGVMVGGDAGGTTVGVAPNAKWIAAKIFNDSGTSTATAIHQSFQWLLDPDGNPNTADAPNVVNNSWTYANPGCYLDFEPDLQSLRAAGILPIFAAGNGGSSSNTSYSPSNNPSAFAVGAINNSNQIYSLSSRGPTTCGGSSGPFPELVAPGINIRTTDLYNGYYNATGTSLAAPHVAAGLALILSAYPNLSAADQGLALINSAVDLGAPGPDDMYGYGRLNLLAAFNWFADNPTSTPAPANTPTLIPTFTPVPTNTPTVIPTFTTTSTPTFTQTPTLMPTSTVTPLSDLIFKNGFEGGNLSAWTSSVVDNGSLSVSTTSALVGGLGLSANINDNTAIYVQDDLPNAETRYRVRFYFDPNSIVMSNGNAHYLLYGYSGTSTVVVRAEFRRSSSTYQLRASLVNDSTNWTNTAWVTIGDAPHFVELDWRASSAVGANDGGLTFWVDGTQQSNLTGIDNDTRRIDRSRFGAVAGIDTATRGTEYLDAFESRRTSYIGADVSAPTPTSTVTATFSPTPTVTPTNTSVGPTNTATTTPSATATSTNTPIGPTNTATATPSATAISTNTPIGPANTPTFTPVPPSPTFTQTNTPTATATAPSGFPSSSVLENFNRANGAPGTNWGGATSGYGIVSNSLDVGSGGEMLWGSTLFGANQEAFVTLTTVDSAGLYQDLLLKSQSATTWENGVIDVSYDAGGDRVQVWTYSNAQGWVQRGTYISVTFVNGDQFGARVKSDGTVEVYRNGLLIGSRNVSAWTYSANGGYIGVLFQGAGTAVLDNFGGSSIAP